MLLRKHPTLSFAVVQYCARGSLHDVLIRAGRSKVNHPGSCGLSWACLHVSILSYLYRGLSQLLYGHPVGGGGSHTGFFRGQSVGSRGGIGCM